MSDKKLLTIIELKQKNGESAQPNYLIMHLINHIELLQMQIDELKKNKEDKRCKCCGRPLSSHNTILNSCNHNNGILITDH